MIFVDLDLIGYEDSVLYLRLSVSGMIVFFSITHVPGIDNTLCVCVCVRMQRKEKDVDERVRALSHYTMLTLSHSPTQRYVSITSQVKKHHLGQQKVYTPSLRCEYRWEFTPYLLPAQEQEYLGVGKESLAWWVLRLPFSSVTCRRTVCFLLSSRVASTSVLSG